MLDQNTAAPAEQHLIQDLPQSQLPGQQPLFSMDLLAKNMTPAKNAAADSILPDFAIGTGRVIGAIAEGAYDASTNKINTLAGEANSTWQKIQNAYNSTDQLPAFFRRSLQQGQQYAAALIDNPGQTLAKTADAAAAVVSSAGQGLETAGGVALNSVEAAGSWVGSHKLETAAMVGAAAVEVISVGTATPVVAGLGAIAAAGTVSSIFSLGDHLNEHAADISLLADPQASATDHQKAFSAIANATGGDAIGLAASITGIGAAKIVADVRGAQPVADAIHETKPLAGAKLGDATTFHSAPVSDTSWHNIYQTQFPVDEQQSFTDLNAMAADGSIPQVKLQLSKVDGKTAAFSMTSDYGDLGNGNGQGLLLPYIAVDKGLQGQGIGGAHLEQMFDEAKNAYPNAKGMLVEVEDPNAPGISAEDAAKRVQRISWYEQHDAHVLDKPYVIPSTEEGADPLPGRLIWRDFGRGGLNDDGLNTLIEKIYEHGYGLPADHPVVQGVRGS